jgi:hypothetical protein
MESHDYSLTINKDKHVNEIFANVAQFSIYPKKGEFCIKFVQIEYSQIL